MKLTKAKFRLKLTDANLKNQLSIVQLMLNGDINRLASMKQY